MSNTDTARLNQALLLLQNGKAEECERLCIELLRNQITLADTNHVLALSYRAQGKLEDAENSIKKSLSQSQNNPTILNSYALILLDRKQPKKALKFLKRALALNPSMASAHSNLGHTQKQLGLLEDAELSYRKALHLSPQLTDALVQLSLLLRSDGRSKEINFLPEISSEPLPQDPGIALIYGLLALDGDSPERAEALFNNALQHQPQSTELLVNLGISLARQGKIDAAEATYKRALDVDPSLTEAYVNLADLWKYDSPGLARTYLVEAVKLDPHDKSTHDMLGFSHFMERDFDAAIESYDRALCIDPSFERAIFHKAGAHFLKGEFPAAWREYNRKYGPDCLAGSPIGQVLKLWDGTSASDSPILVWTDQGMGDEILQLGLVADIYEKNIPIIIATSDRLVPIAQRTFPKSTCISNAVISPDSMPPGSPKSQCPAIYLGSILRNSFDAFPEREAYLVADEENAGVMRRGYLDQNSDGPLIGISWRSTNQVFGRQKSLTLFEFLPVLSARNCTFIDLQYGETREDLAELPIDIQQRIISDDSVDPLLNMNTFADQVRAVDLVITTSNTTAHMAGALGRPTWVLVPRMGPGWLWYWFDGLDRSPWYPKTRLFRQRNDGDWTAPISNMESALLDFVKEYQSLTAN